MNNQSKKLEVVKKSLYDVYADNKDALAILSDVDRDTFNKIGSEPVTFDSGVNAMTSQGLSYALKDYYVFIQKGNKLAIQPTPKGTKKLISRIAKQHGLSVVINEGTFNEGDVWSVESDGQFDTFKMKKDPNAMLTGGKVISSYAFVTVYKDDEKITSKLIYIPQNEYQKIKAMAKGSANYEMMFASKVIIKRVLAGIYLLLGVSLDDEHKETMTMLEEANRVDLEEESEEDQRYDVFFDMRDGIGMYLLNQELVQNAPDEEHDEAPYKWMKFWDRFPKGAKGKLKQIETNLFEEGRLAVEQLQTALDSDDSFAVLELLEGITNPAKVLLCDFFSLEDCEKLKAIVKNGV